ncbi:Fork-head domain-containing protein [Entamoeba marina]
MQQYPEATPCHCLLCEEFSESVKIQKRLAWTTLCRLSFLSMNTTNPSDFVNVRDLFIFIANHWDILGHLEQLKKKTWKKSILDALNHSDFFQSGISQYHTNGYWKLVDTTIPNIKTRKGKGKEREKEKLKQPTGPVKPATPQIKPEVDARPVYKELPLERPYVIPKFSNDYYYPHYDSYHDSYHDLYPRTFQYRNMDYNYYSEYSHYQHPLS